MNASTLGAALVAVSSLTASTMVLASSEQDRAEIAAIDIKYQDAVKRNDAAIMAQILHEDFVLVLGTGKTYTRADLLESARTRHITYERQDEDAGTQTVRLWGDHTAVVTARLWLKYVADGKSFERRLWFSDTYIRTAQGWRYVFGQASIALPAE
jgi:ketosteroid isomerase-like protein